MWNSAYASINCDPAHAQRPSALVFPLHFFRAPTTCLSEMAKCPLEAWRPHVSYLPHWRLIRQTYPLCRTVDVF